MDEKEKNVEKFFEKKENFQEKDEEMDISSTYPDKAEEKSENINSFTEKKKHRDPITYIKDLITDRKPLTNKKLFRIFWIFMILLGSVSIAQYAVAGMNDLLAVGRKDNDVVVKIPENASVSDICKILKQNEVINNESFFGLYSFATKANKKVGRGTYTLKTNMDYEAIISHLENQSNRLDIVNVTFREGLNLEEYASILEEKRICNAKDFLALCNSDVFDNAFDFVKEIKPNEKKKYKLEGYLFPDTYDFYDGENPKQVIRKFLYNYYNKVYSKNEVEGYEKRVSLNKVASDKGKDINEIIIIASLIQAEAANNKDMYNVSSVLHNRLGTLKNDGMNRYGEGGLKRLALDSTVWYPYKNISMVPVEKRSTYKSDYDTYNIDGLPPGPICNPGLEAIKAAISPNSTDYYYFCHSSKGVAYYARTLPEHNNNLFKAGLI